MVLQAGPGEPLEICVWWLPEPPALSGAWPWGGGGGEGCGREQRNVDTNFSPAKRSISFPTLWQLHGKVNLGRWLEVEHSALDPFLSSSSSSPKPSYPFHNGQYYSFPKENTAGESMARFPSSGFGFRCFADFKLQSLTTFSSRSPSREPWFGSCTGLLSLTGLWISPVWLASGSHPLLSLKPSG